MEIEEVFYLVPWYLGLLPKVHLSSVLGKLALRVCAEEDSRPGDHLSDFHSISV